jgi:hypothetical protein
VERGSDKHGARQDDELKSELGGMLGNAGGHREEWLDPEPPADDDPERPDMAPSGAESETDAEADTRMARLRHDLDVANDSRFEDRDIPGPPDV